MLSNNYIHVMVDIETLDTQPSAVILSIGACTIDEQSTFYVECDRWTQDDRTVSDATVTWWNAQGGQPVGHTPLAQALKEFSNWIKQLGAEPIIWCKGTDFDVSILANAFTYHIRQPVPWRYNNVRDMRTLKKLHPQLFYSKNPEPHHALQDALHQAWDLKQIFAYNPQLQWG